PFTLVATIDAGSGVTFVKGQWKSVRGSAMHIDSYASLSATGGTAALSSSQGDGNQGAETGGTGAGNVGGGGERD
ncbi:fucose-binding lectin II, partial [Burkholderia cenocepacia]|nr:fucose-binding lectin II [Burkholderia cenocepacia]